MKGPDAWRKNRQLCYTQFTFCAFRTVPFMRVIGSKHVASTSAYVVRIHASSIAHPCEKRLFSTFAQPNEKHPTSMAHLVGTIAASVVNLVGNHLSSIAHLVTEPQRQLFLCCIK